jgi:hypothetical protein
MSQKKSEKPDFLNEILAICLRLISIIQIYTDNKQGDRKMEQSNRIEILLQTSFSLWILSFTLMVLVWSWTQFSQHEAFRGKRPSLNLKAL